MSADGTSPITSPVIDEAALRVDLAAAFRLAVKFDWHEGVANHFSAAVSADGKKFLMNPKWRHFQKIRASELLLLDADDEETMSRPGAPDPSAWCIHGAIHRANPGGRVLLHCHPHYATALLGPKDPRMLPIEQTTARFYDLVSDDDGFSGIADEAEEGARLAQVMGDKPILAMGNHGLTCAAATVAEAFDHLYHYERAAMILLIAYASGRPLNVMGDNLAQKTAEGWRAYSEAAFAHFEQMKELLDDEDASYRD
jgi:ribulose-5-phosphate 4-epimerase/fuculose-1-phosphate aldolase